MQSTLLRDTLARLSRSKAEPLRLCFWLGVVIFLVAGARLASANHSDGGWDSASNLIAARSVATGHGFTTLQVQDLVVPHTIPGPETVRAPGSVYVMGMVFRMTGVSLSAVVWVNLLTVLFAALCLRAAVRLVGPRWVADVAGLLILASPSNYELVSLVNNDELTAIVCIAMLMLGRIRRGDWGGMWLAIGCGVLGAAAFLVKQSYILGFTAFSLVVLLADTRYRLRARIARVALAGALMAALSASYWYPNIRDHGTPLYSPIQKLRLPLRYGLLPLDGYQAAVYLHREVPAYGEIARTVGVRTMLRRELDIVRLLPAPLFGRGALMFVWAIAGLIFLRRKRWILATASVSLAIPAFFDALWWVPEPRYFYPTFPILIFLAALGTNDYLIVERAQLHPAVSRRFRLAFALLFTLIAVGTLLQARWGWRTEFAQAREPAPAWISAVESVPPDAVIMTSSPPRVSWWTARRTVIEPLGSRADLVEVLDMYRPGYYLDVAPGPRATRAPFEATELEPMSKGDSWALYRIIR
jgi:hypothetical protein